MQGSQGTVGCFLNLLLMNVLDKDAATYFGGGHIYLLTSNIISAVNY